MAELALAALLAVALLVERAHQGLGVHAKRHFLRLDGLEEICGLALGLFGGFLIPFTLFLRGLLLLVFGTFVGLLLRLHLGYLFLRLRAFFLYHPITLEIVCWSHPQDW